MEDETTRTAYASRLLGRSATELAPAMNQGAQEIEHLRGEAHRLGLVYEDELIDSGVRLGDNILALTRAFEAFKTKAIAPVVGFLVQVTDRMLGQVTTASKLKDSLYNVETALQRYKRAQSEARDSTDVFTQAMETQALAVLRTALLDMIKVYEEAQKELPKLNKSVEENIRLQGTWEKVIGDADKAWESITKNTKFAGDSFRDFVSNPDIDQAMWQITNELLGLGWGMKETQVATEQLRRSWWDYGEAVEELSKLQRDKLELDTKVGESTQGQEALIRSLAMAYVDGDRELIEYIKHNEEVYNKTMAMVDAIELHNYAVDKAKNVIAGFSTKTLESTQALIDRYEKMDTATLSTEMLAVRTEVLNQLYVKQSELLAEQAKETEDLAEKEKARKAIIDLANEAVERAVEYHEALGEAFDLDAEKTSIYTNAIKDLIDSGLAPTEGRITELLGKMPKLAEVTEEFVDSTKSAEDIMGEWNEELWESSYQLQVAGDLQAYYRRMIGATQDAMVDMLRNGIEPSSEEFQKLARMVEGFNKKLAESEEKSEEWKNTTVSVLREVSSVFSSLEP